MLPQHPPSLLLWRASASSHSLTFLRQWSCLLWDNMESLLGLRFVSFVIANEPGNRLKGQALADRGLTSFVCTRMLCLRNHYLALDGVIFFSLSLPRYKFNYLVTATLIKKAFSLEVSFRNFQEIRIIHGMSEFFYIHILYGSYNNIKMKY